MSELAKLWGNMVFSSDKVRSLSSLQRDWLLTTALTLTGARRIQKIHANFVRDILSTIEPGRLVITGAAIGFDTTAAKYVAERGDLYLATIVPASTSQADVYWLSRCDMYEQMPKGTSMIDRDWRMVDLGVETWGFPMFDREDVRSEHSGTWHTLKFTEKADKPIKYWILAQIED